MKPTSLLFGTAGTPLASKDRGSLAGVAMVRSLGLDCMELEFVRGVKMSPALAAQVKSAAEQNKVVLTAHGPYFINLNSLEKATARQSAQRIIDTARVTSMTGGYSITFHAAYYMKQDPAKVYDIVKAEMKEILKTLKDEGIKIWVRPETTGKGTQWGTITEIIKLSQEIDGVMPCVDFAHLHSRSNGKFNSYPEFNQVLGEIEKGLGREGLDNMHIHMSGIAYTEKGERNHLELKESDFKYKELMKALKEFKAKGVVINESPNLESDALLMKKTYESS
jgi:deoxyribonuclease-4